MANKKRWTVATILFLALLAGLVAYTLPNYGLTWDEKNSLMIGRMILAYYVSGFQDMSLFHHKEEWELPYFGGFFFVSAVLLNRITSWGMYESGHILSALFGLMTVIFTIKSASEIEGPRTGLIAGLMLVCIPMFYGHLFSNPKDIPFAGMYTLCLYLTLRSHRYLPDIPGYLILLLGICLGLALGIRFIGGFSFIFLALFWAVWVYTNKPEKAVALKLLRTYVWICVLAVVVTLPWYPLFQQRPLQAFQMELQQHVRWHFNEPVLFNSVMIPASQLPRSYAVVWFLVCMPEFVFIGLALSVLLLLKRNQFSAGLQTALVFASFFVPLVVVIVLRSRLYDAIRQLMFILPPMCILMAISLNRFLRPAIPRWSKLLVTAAIAISMTVTVYDMVQMHPYEYVYFNRLIAGGMEQGSKKFETDYWGATYKEGAEWIMQHYGFNGPPIRVSNCNTQFLSKYFFDKTPEGKRRFVSVEMQKHADVFLATTRFDCHKSVDRPPLHVISRKNVPLLYIFELNPVR